MFAENFLTVRSVYPRPTLRPVSATSSVRLIVLAPLSEEERDYRDRLNEANLNFFHREYGIALQNYLDLRAAILQQGYPELPDVGGAGSTFRVDPSTLDPRRFLAVSKKILLDTDPGHPVKVRGGAKRRVLPGEFPVNREMAALSGIGLDPDLVQKGHIEAVLAGARQAVADENVAAALELYDEARKLSARETNFARTAAILNEGAAVRATHAKGPQARRELDRARKELEQAEELFDRAGDESAAAAVKRNRASIDDAGEAPKTFRVLRGSTWSPLNSTIAAAKAGQARKVGLMTSSGAKQVALDGDFESNVISSIYDARVTATSLDALTFHEQVETNFVAYLVHLFYFVLPVALGDIYLAMGRYEEAINTYREVLVYPFVNANIEANFIWLRIAKVWLEWGNALYRSGRPDLAKAKYEEIVGTGGAVPESGSLYKHKLLRPMRITALETLKALKRQPHAKVNPRGSAVVTEATMRLTAIANGLNFLGLAPDHAPIFRFRHLQTVATYLADNAIQAERTMISFRAGAESQTIERMQLESAVAINQAALDIEKRRVEEVNLEVDAAKETREYAELRAQHARDAIDEWKTKGEELSVLNAALTWAGNTANDHEMDATLKYDGKTHDFHGTVENFFDKYAFQKER